MNGRILTLALAAALSGCEPAPGPGAAAQQANTTPAVAPQAAAPAASATPTATAPSAKPAPAAPQAAPAAPQSADGKRPEKKSAFSSEAQERSRHWQALFAESQQARKAGDTTKALSLLEDVLAIQPSDRQAAREKVQILRQLGQFDKALSAIQEAEKYFANDPPFVEEKARIQLEKGDAHAALATVDGLLKLDMPLPGVRFLRAVVQANLGDKEATLAALEDAERHGFLNPNQIEAEKSFALVANEARYKAVVRKLQSLLSESAAAGAAFQAHQDSEKLPEAGPADDGAQLKSLKENLATGRYEEISVDLKDIDGKPLRTADHAGKVVLVQAWGPWSKGSRQMIPELLKLRDELKGQPVEILTLCFEPAMAESDAQEVALNIKALQNLTHFDFQCAMLEKDYAVRHLHVPAYPTTFFFGKDGRLYLRSTGVKGVRVLRSLVDLLLNPVPPPVSPVSGGASASPADSKGSK